MKNGERKKMDEELEKVDYEDYKSNSYKNAILVECNNCKNCQRIRKIIEIWRGYCEKCNKILVADNKLTNNCKKITWQDYEYYIRSNELKEEIYKT